MWHSEPLRKCVPLHVSIDGDGDLYIASGLQEAISPAGAAAKTSQSAADPQKAAGAPIVQPIANSRPVRPQYVTLIILSCNYCRSCHILLDAAQPLPGRQLHLGGVTKCPDQRGQGLSQQCLMRECSCNCTLTKCMISCRSSDKV